MSGSPPEFVAEVLSYVDAHLFEPMTLSELASVAGFSPHHFSRLFTARFGQSVMGYVRECRLLFAAQRLAGDSPPALITLALDCGFESQEAFTRAFRRRFGVPPGQFKREAINHLSKEMRMSVNKVQTNVHKLDGLVRRDSFAVAGVGALFDNDNKNGIPSLWPRLIRCLPLAGQAGPLTYGVCSMVDRGDGSFRYLAGVEVSGEGSLPHGFERVTLAAQSYAVFRITLDGGALHAQMQAAMPQIWGTLLPKSGYRLAQQPDFELYPADFEPNRKGTYVDIYIPVEP